MASASSDANIMSPAPLPCFPMGVLPILILCHLGRFRVEGEVRPRHGRRWGHLEGLTQPCQTGAQPHQRGLYRLPETSSKRINSNMTSRLTLSHAQKIIEA